MNRPPAWLSPDRTREILDLVRRRTGVPTRRILGHGRTREVVLARHMTAWLMRQVAGLSLKSIGARLGDVDHSTIWHAVGRIDDMIARDPVFGAGMDELIAELDGDARAREVHRETVPV